MQPLFCGTVDAWRRVEEKLQLEFPEDYKRCIDRYGEGEFGEFLYLLNPHLVASGYSYSEHIQEILAACNTMAAAFPNRVPFPIYPAKHGLLPAATTSNGDVVYWETVGDAQDWPIIVFASRYGRYERFELGIVEFIHRLLVGTLASDIIPEDLPRTFNQ